MKLRIPKHRRRQLNNMRRSSAIAPDQQQNNEDTAARVKAVLAQLNQKNYIVLIRVQSDSRPEPYEIRLGTNGGAYCTCKGWQYDKTGNGCKHLKRFREFWKAPYMDRDGNISAF